MSLNFKFEKPRILIADDSIVMRDLIKSFYKEYDFELIHATNGQEAVEMAFACTPDLILLDIQMPVLDGYEAAAILKNDQAVKDIPILVITSLKQRELSKQIDGHYAGYLSKPFQKNDLIKATIQCLSQ